MAFRSMTERADSTSAMILTGFVEPGAWRSGSVCRSTSVMKCRSLGRSTLGTTRASRCVPRSTAVRSERAKPELTLLIRTACSRIPATRSRFRIVTMFSRASGFFVDCNGIFEVVGYAVHRETAGFLKEAHGRAGDWHTLLANVKMSVVFVEEMHCG